MIPWSEIWQPTPVFLHEESHGQRSPIGYSSWGHKEADMTKHARVCAYTLTHTHIYIDTYIYIYIYIYCAVLGHELGTKQQQNN